MKKILVLVLLMLSGIDTSFANDRKVEQEYEVLEYMHTYDRYLLKFATEYANGEYYIFFEEYLKYLMKPKTEFGCCHFLQESDEFWGDYMQYYTTLDTDYNTLVFNIATYWSDGDSVDIILPAIYEHFSKF